MVNVEQTINTDPVVKNCGDSLYILQSSVCDVLENGQQKSSNEESINHRVDFETTSNTNGHQESPPKNFSSRTQLLPNSTHSSATTEVLLRDSNCSTSNTDLCLQWRNKYNLCWLDCVLSALVHLEALKFALVEDDEKCLLQRLLTKYNQATVLLNTCKRSKVKGEFIQLLFFHIQTDLIKEFSTMPLKMPLFYFKITNESGTSQYYECAGFCALAHRLPVTPAIVSVFSVG